MSFFFKVARINDPSQLADGVVTLAKLATDSVNSSKIVDDSITYADLEDDVKALIFLTAIGMCAECFNAVLA